MALKSELALVVPGIGDRHGGVGALTVMVLSVFAGITGYIFITRKDFSWMGSILSMGVMVIFGACLLSFVFHTEVFSLAVASAGALLSIGMLLYVTFSATARWTMP